MLGTAPARGVFLSSDHLDVLPILLPILLPGHAIHAGACANPGTPSSVDQIIMPMYPARAASQGLQETVQHN